MKYILSLGAGVQSSTVLLMSCTGDLPKLDAAIFADTGWEPAAVYEHFEWIRNVAAEHGIPVHRVTVGNIRNDTMVSQVRGTKAEGSRWASMPLRTISPDGKEGMIRRQCTKEYKIEPIHRMIRVICGLSPKSRPKGVLVEHWYGISLDEMQRMRTSDRKWIKNRYPLVERRMTRHLCLDWLEQHGFPMPPRSACIGCPFHSNAEWRDMKLHRPDEFEDACQVDDAIRNMGGMRGQVFLHRNCRPLREVDLRSDFDRGQLPLFDGEQDIGCDSGHCFV